MVFFAIGKLASRDQGHTVASFIQAARGEQGIREKLAEVARGTCFIQVACVREVDVGGVVAYLQQVREESTTAAQSKLQEVSAYMETRNQPATRGTMLLR